MLTQATKDWRYMWYSIVPGVAWGVYAFWSKDKSWEVFVRFLAGNGAGGFVAYIQNEWLGI